MPDVGIHQKGEVDLQILLQKLKRELGGKAGAVGCFVGIVRDISKDGKKVKYLHYECAEEAIKELEQIAADIERQPGILRVMIHHVIDDLTPGEDAIYILVAGKHRAEVFSVLPQIMDRIKAKALIWKKEVTETEEYWINE
ncbi:MAG: molybdenum cofactor biosynthesis protein MoaE [Hadesarchaea archaeon]|nr:molybdenum cofactor biosynthesis protein MoaE [Hadesarchaea archaeon]MDH5684998.1 molybdenum cofactor biosynthesis protein MoaE [Hadesarchaea archaeon]